MNNIKVYSVDQIRQLEQRAIGQYDIAGFELMQRASRGALHCLKQYWPNARSIYIFVGSGNNGGDGLMLAYWLHQEHQGQVTVQLCAAPEQFKGEAKAAYETCVEAGIAISHFSHGQFDADLIVDALLGIGIQGAPRGQIASVIATINRNPAPVLALDIPSGLCAEQGIALGETIKAQRTITFIGHKAGLLIGDSREYVGAIHVDDLQLPQVLFTQVSAMGTLLTERLVNQHLIPRRRNSYKGNFGHVLVIGGNAGMGGAPLMAGLAAARCGAGLVSIATHPDHAGAMIARAPELMCHAIHKKEQLMALIDRATVIAVGPGLGQDRFAQKLWQMAIASDKPLVVDADGLNLLARKPQQRKQWVLTPHAGEGARLLQSDGKSIKAAMPQSAMALEQKYGGVVVLKGAGTIVYDQQHRFAFCPYGNPGMATGGMGDILTGIIAALLAQLKDLDVAAKLGVLVHSLAADQAAELGERSLLATDLLTTLRTIIH